MLGGELNAPRRLASKQPSDDGAEELHGERIQSCQASPWSRPFGAWSGRKERHL